MHPLFHRYLENTVNLLFDNTGLNSTTVYLYKGRTTLNLLILIESKPRQIFLSRNPITEKATVIWHNLKNTFLKFLLSDEAEH